MNSSGRMSYGRFRVVGPSQSASFDLVTRFAQKGFVEQPLTTPDTIEIGWVAGDHMYDADFGHAKNLFPGAIRVAMRRDTHKVPPEMAKAMKSRIEKNLASNNENGSLTKAQQSEAKLLLESELRSVVADGKRRRSKLIPMVWFPADEEICLGSTSTAVADDLYGLVSDTVNEFSMEVITAGSLAARHITDLAVVTPTPFIERETGPLVPWANTGDRNDFLGNEFLLWLWWNDAIGDGELLVESLGGEHPVTINVVDAIKMECAWGELGKCSIADKLPGVQSSARKALSSGMLPRQVGLHISHGDELFTMTLCGDQMTVSGLAVYSPDEIKCDREQIEFRIAAIRSLNRILDACYGRFLSERTDATWWADTSNQIRTWINA